MTLFTPSITHYMKKILLGFLFCSFLQMNATTWQVSATGGPGLGTPLFTPSLLTIEVGDVVNWNWTSGQHNVAATSGPESFNSGSHVAPFQWSFTFTQSGSYDYECTLFNHADTQFGTITVTPLSISNLDAPVNFDLSIYPNPANDMVTIAKSIYGISTVKLIDMAGKVISSSLHNSDLITTMSVADLPRGLYFIEVQIDGVLARRKLLIQ